jgi:hypothetical protein
MTDTVPANEPVERAGAPSPSKEAIMATKTTEIEIDEQALVLRRQSTGFGKIAQALGLERAHDANEAFNRALRLLAPEEQATVRAEEGRRLDRLATAVSADGTRSKEEVDKRLRAIERLRSRLLTD